MSFGYSARLIELNKEADAEHIGVRLGKLCIEKKIPVQATASRFNVSRQTVYNWFAGKTLPKEPALSAVSSYLDS